MTRETRLNLIVLAILLAVLTPAGVVLFRKKLQPTLKPMAAPHAVATEIAYLSPLETPPGRKRVEPPHVARWIESLVRERIGSATQRKVERPSDPDGLPLMSDKRTLQVVAAEAGPGEWRLWLILWDRRPVLDAAWTARVAGVDQPPRVIGSLAIPVPPLVREELGELGVLRPPHEIIWQEIVLPREGSASIRLQRPSTNGGPEGGGDFVDFVPSFTNSGTTRH